MSNHSFNVVVAEKYGIEKAILLENFYFWCKKNKANKKNIFNGRAYTYNTSEAFEELFPYMKARKIAQLLREMEAEDNLLISGQFGVDGNKHDRTKFYTLSDNALSFFEQCNIQNSDNGKAENCIMENTKNGDCLYTDINTDVNTDINSYIPSDEGKEKTKPLDDNAIKLANLLYKECKKQNDKFKATVIQLRNWASDIEKINRIDGYDYSTIKEVLLWCKNDDFWSANIQSGAKFRKQFNVLIVRSKNNADKKPYSNQYAKNAVGQFGTDEEFPEVLPF